VSLFITQEQPNVTIRDFGTGMSSDVISKTLLLYSSTKLEGRGIGVSPVKLK
jgi:nitrogen fixation/metabolism regulation signal transduction histidine kinase